MTYDNPSARTGGRGGRPGARRGGAPRHGRGRPAGEDRLSPEARDEIAAWFTGRLPDDWFVGSPALTVDLDEILVEGALHEVELPDGATDEARATAEGARIDRFREETRSKRMQIADEAQARYGRVVSWGASAGQTAGRFTTAKVPVMTRASTSRGARYSTP